MIQSSQLQQQSLAESAQLDQARKGDREAFISLAEQHLDSLYRFAAREIRYYEALGYLEPGELTPEDVVSDVFIQALQSMKTMPRYGSFKGQLRRLALSAVRRAARESTERRRFEKVHLEHPVPWSRDDYEGSITRPRLWEEIIPDRNAIPPDPYVEFRETLDALEGALNKLPEDQRIAFILHSIEQLSYPEIASILGKPVAEVKSLYHTSRETLRRWLAGAVDGWVSTASQQLREEGAAQ
jgi:RNA polymerase sigma-70 factor (ECF subfamily)